MEHVYTRENLEAECRIEFFRSTGPGGQNKNRRETGVRLTHLPTGEVVLAVERRSQLQNVEIAYKRMGERLKKRFHKAKPRRKTRPTRASVGRRLDSKKRKSKTKSTRKKPNIDRE